MKITKQQLKQIIKEELTKVQEWVVAPGRDSRGEPVDSDEQDLETQLRDETDKQLIEILKETLEEAYMAYDYGGLDYVPGIIRRLKEALNLLGEERAQETKR